MFIRNSWYVAAWADEIVHAPLARTLLGEAIVLFRDRTGAVGALEDRCCHRGTPLRFGLNEVDGRVRLLEGAGAEQELGDEAGERILGGEAGHR